MDFEQVRKLIDRSKHFVIVIHTRPDGDAVGSGLGLKMALEQNGKQAALISPDPLPGFLQWLPGANEIMVFSDDKEAVKQKLNEADVIFIVDFNTFSRAGDELGNILENLHKQKPFVMIDHHLQPDRRIPYVFSDTSKASSAEMVFDFVKKTGLAEQFTPGMATAIYTGILTDTGSFRFDKTTGETHRKVSELIDAGAKNSEIYSNIFDTYSYNKLQLLGEAIRRMKIIPECAVSYIVLDKETLKKFNFKQGDTEGIVNYGLMLQGIKFTVLFTEKPGENTVRLSLRSKGNFDVNTFARKYFKGGGHKNAAGGSFIGTPEEAEKYFFEKVKNHCEEIKQS
jgi:phosphoesterase RecJ-like protein